MLHCHVSSQDPLQNVPDFYVHLLPIKADLLHKQGRGDFAIWSVWVLSGVYIVTAMGWLLPVRHQHISQVTCVVSRKTLTV